MSSNTPEPPWAAKMRRALTPTEIVPTLHEPLLSINEVAKLLVVSRSTVYRLLRAGDLVAFRVGRRVRIAPEQLRAYLRVDATQERS